MFSNTTTTWFLVKLLGWVLVGTLMATLFGIEPPGRVLGEITFQMMLVIFYV